MKVAIVHDWLTNYMGSERVLQQLLSLFPTADCFSVADFLSEEDRRQLRGVRPQVSFIQRMPFARKYLRHYLPLMPLAVEQFDLSAYDVIVSSSHAVAKGVLTGPDQFHVCYCHSPIRYAWDLQHEYLQQSGHTTGAKSFVARLLLHYMRLWDLRTANGVDHFIANSDFIARRIRKTYGRAASVIYPPVDVDAFTLCASKEDFYLTAGRAVPYKRLNAIVEAFTLMPDKRLVVIGDGPCLPEARVAAGSNITFLGYQSSAVLKDYMQRARAFVFAAQEDFGIVAVEAQACGTPVICYGKGGATETVIDGKTGVHFSEQTPHNICAAVAKFESELPRFNPYIIRKHAERFGTDTFRREFLLFMEREWKVRQEDYRIIPVAS